MSALLLLFGMRDCWGKMLFDGRVREILDCFRAIRWIFCGGVRIIRVHSTAPERHLFYNWDYVLPIEPLSGRHR